MKKTIFLFGAAIFSLTFLASCGESPSAKKHRLEQEAIIEMGKNINSKITLTIETPNQIFFERLQRKLVKKRGDVLENYSLAIYTNVIVLKNRTSGKKVIFLHEGGGKLFLKQRDKKIPVFSHENLEIVEKIFLEKLK